jgi:hypothetical protein
MHPAPSPGSYPSDPLFTSIDALVRDGTLTPDQANRVYHSVRDSGGATMRMPAAAREPSRSPNRVVVTGACLLLGAGLLLSGGVVADILATNHREFNWRAFVVVLGATLALLAAAAAVDLLDKGVAERTWLASGLAALGAVGAGLSVDSAFNDHGGSGYAAGLLILALSVAGYVALRGAALAASAVLGGLVVLAAALGDSSDSLGSGTGECIIIVLYGVAVVAAGWVLPCRNVTGVLGGLVALFGVFVGLVSAGVMVLVSGLGPGAPGLNDSHGDLTVATVIGFLVTAGLLGLYAVTRYPGYAILGVAGAVTIPVASLFSFASGSALRWGTVVAAVGAVIVAGSVLLARQAVASSRSSSQPNISAS